MTVNVVCRLGWATVPRYLITHYSGCFCEGVFGDRMNIWISGFGVMQVILIMWIGLLWSIDSLNRAKAATTTPHQEWGKFCKGQPWTCPDTSQHQWHRPGDIATTGWSLARLEPLGVVYGPFDSSLLFLYISIVSLRCSFFKKYIYLAAPGVKLQHMGSSSDQASNLGPLL